MGGAAEGRHSARSLRTRGRDRRDGGVCRRSGVLVHHRGESYRGWRNECLNRRTRSHIANLGKVIPQYREGRRDWRSAGTMNTQQKSNGGRCPMANVVKKHSISYELAQKMVDAAVAKARELGVSENVAILDDGGNLKAFGRMDGAPIPTTEMAQNKAYTALFGVSTQEFFNFIQSDPSLLAGIPTLARMAAWGGGFPIKVNGEVVGAIGLSGAPTVQNDIDCAKAALALVSDAVPPK